MALAPKEKELVATAISVAAGCKPCTDYHVKAARRAEASEAAIRRAIEDGLAVRRKAADIMEAHSRVHLGDGLEAFGLGCPGAPDRVGMLARLGAAFAVNCVSSFEYHLGAAELSNISRAEVAEVLKLAAFIKQRATSHVERLVGWGQREAA
jgi:AhpD family alkylhydroperoxidase